MATIYGTPVILLKKPEPLPAKGKTLNEYTWDEISRISLADKAVEYGFKVGDAKEVTLNGSVGYGSAARTFNNQKYWVYIIGINHNEAKEGKGIAFQGFKTAQTGGIDIDVTATNYGSYNSGMVMNPTNTNSGGWAGSVAYKTIMSQWKACFPSDLQAVIRTTTLYTDNTGNSSTSASTVTANSNEVYYLAEYEVFGVNKYANPNEPAQQAWYDYYKAGNSKVKYRSDDTSTAAPWLLRSPGTNDANVVWSAYSNGKYGRDNASVSGGVRPALILPPTALIDSKGNITGKTQSLSGTWVFNSTLGNPSFLSYTPQDVSIQASSNSLDITAMRFEISTATDAMQILYMLPGSSVSAYGSTEGIWTNQAYRVITFTEPFKRENNAAFYDWFINNATRGGN